MYPIRRRGSAVERLCFANMWSAKFTISLLIVHEVECMYILSVVVVAVKDFVLRTCVAS